MRLGSMRRWLNQETGLIEGFGWGLAAVVLLGIAVLTVYVLRI